MVYQHFPIIVKIAYQGIFPPFSNPERRALLDRPRRLEVGRRLTSIGTAVGGLLDTKGVPKDLPQPQPVLSEDDTLIGHQPATIQGVMGHDPRMRQFQGGTTWVSGSRPKRCAPWKKWCKYANKSGIHDKNGKTINRISIWAVDCCKTPLSHCQTIQKCKWDLIHQPGHWAPWESLLSYRVTRGSSPKRTWQFPVGLELHWIATFVYRRSEARPSIGCPSSFIKPWRKSSLARRLNETQVSPVECQGCKKGKSTPTIQNPKVATNDSPVACRNESPFLRRNLHPPPPTTADPIPRDSGDISPCKRPWGPPRWKILRCCGAMMFNKGSGSSCRFKQMMK